jgi:hypothetical protein
MMETVEQLLLRNLADVFGEADSSKRTKAIASIWAQDGQLLAFPVLVGHGLSLSPAGTQPSLYRLDRHQSFDDGTVEMVYIPL